MAYFFGFFFGKTPLIKLSPKKTWEGFCGGFVSTLVFAFFFSALLAKIPFITCPVNRKHLLKTSYFSFEDCHRINAVFSFQLWTLPASLTTLLHFLTGRSIESVRVAPIQWHSLVMGMFASAIGPFGGFFASGFKRAFKIKDFSASIPGHGGVTDRMDCQFLMGLFSYVYFRSFIKLYRPDVTSVALILAKIINDLSPQDQLILYERLKQHLSLK
jgi:phosphatidate cytidylyltransferase